MQRRINTVDLTNHSDFDSHTFPPQIANKCWVFSCFHENCSDFVAPICADDLNSEPILTGLDPRGVVPLSDFHVLMSE